MKGNIMRIAILGGGAMGKVLAEMTEEKEGFELAGIIEPMEGQKPQDIEGADVIIDFSNPANLQMLVDYCRETGCPAVIATTGFVEEQIKQIEELAQAVPVVFSANYSLGINVMKRVVAEITPILEDAFDIEIIEKHHNKKLDAPSGTAKMLLDAADGEGKYDHIFGREGNRKRGKEIGVHAIRGGNIAGEHTVIYAGEDEILEIRHNAGSKKIFASGALTAAAYASKAQAGLYTMEDVLFGSDK